MAAWFVLAFDLTILVVTGAVVYLVHRKLSVDDGEPWDAGAVALAQDVRAVASDGRASEYHDVQRRLVPLASRIEGHLRSAPPDADGRLQQCVYELAVECRKVGMEHPHRAVREPFDEKLEALDEKARFVEQTADAS